MTNQFRNPNDEGKWGLGFGHSSLIRISDFVIRIFSAWHPIQMAQIDGNGGEDDRRRGDWVNFVFG
jgi:hypothetical protein